MEATIHVDPKVFEHFRPFAGRVPSGYWANWLGVLTRADVWAFQEPILAIYRKDRYEQTACPLSDEHVLDWVPLLEAVVASDGECCIAAAGAGWGRWLSAGAFAAVQTGRTYRLTGVEAEPEHFKWMELHFRENHLDPDRFRLIHAAATSYTGYGWFYVGDSAAWYGQSLVPESAVSVPNAAALEPGTELPYGNYRIKRVRCMGLDEILRDGRTLDYLHMDIQGSEAEFLMAQPELLQRQVKMVNVGTHSHEIEQTLRGFFTKLGWTNRFDVPMNGEVQVLVGDKDIGKVKFGDGVQVWRR